LQVFAQPESAVFYSFTSPHFASAMSHFSVFLLALCVLVLSSCTLMSSARPAASPLSRHSLHAQTGNLTTECYSDPKCTVPTGGQNDTVVIGWCYEHPEGSQGTRAEARLVKAALSCAYLTNCAALCCVSACQVTTPIPVSPYIILTLRLSAFGHLLRETGVAARKWITSTTRLLECATRKRHASLLTCRWKTWWTIRVPIRATLCLGT
jgi:hypothetical protein